MASGAGEWRRRVVSGEHDSDWQVTVPAARMAAQADSESRSAGKTRTVAPLNQRSNLGRFEARQNCRGIMNAMMPELRRVAEASHGPGPGPAGGRRRPGRSLIASN